MVNFLRTPDKILTSFVSRDMPSENICVSSGALFMTISASFSFHYSSVFSVASSFVLTLERISLKKKKDKVPEELP